MDGKRFDAAVRAAVTSRRRILGLALGGAFATIGGTASAAQCRKRCGPCKRCKHGHCKLKPDGSSCGAGNVCNAGVCLMTGTCPDPQEYCGATNVCGPVANDCRCFATAGGSSICGSFELICNGCTSDADCSPGWACVSGAGCGCGGNGCAPGCPAR